MEIAKMVANLFYHLKLEQTLPFPFQTHLELKPPLYLDAYCISDPQMLRFSYGIWKPDVFVWFLHGRPFYNRMVKTSGFQMFPGFKCPVFGSLFSQNNEFFCWIFEQLLVGDLPDIVVGVPSRVVAHLKSGNLLLSKSLELLVIDEADLIFSFGYEDDLKTILKHLPEKGYQVNIRS